jgi:hypothetical protein
MVNDTIMHFTVHSLPFGGVGDSGIGGTPGQQLSFFFFFWGGDSFPLPRATTTQPTSFTCSLPRPGVVRRLLAPQERTQQDDQVRPLGQVPARHPWRDYSVPRAVTLCTYFSVQVPAVQRQQALLHPDAGLRRKDGFCRHTAAVLHVFVSKLVCMSCLRCGNVVCADQGVGCHWRKRAIAPTSHTQHTYTRVCALVCLRRLPWNCMCPQSSQSTAHPGGAPPGNPEKSVSGYLEVVRCTQGDRVRGRHVVTIQKRREAAQPWGLPQPLVNLGQLAVVDDDDES